MEWLLKHRPRMGWLYGIVLIAATQSPLAYAETASATDVTGSIITTTDLITPSRQPQLDRDVFRPRWLVRARVLEGKISQLIDGRATGFPVELQRDLARVLLQSGDYSQGAYNIAQGLMELTPKTQPLFVHQLMRSLLGLAKNERVTISRMKKAVRSFNSLVWTLPSTSLTNPTWELTAIQWTLLPVTQDASTSPQVNPLNYTETP